MTNLHLRRRVAEALGWTEIKCIDRDYQWLEGIPPEGGDYDADVPEWDTDKAAAWELVERMAGDEPLEVVAHWGGKTWAYSVCFGSRKKWIVKDSDALCVAICEVFLEWSSSDDEPKQ